MGGSSTLLNTCSMTDAGDQSYCRLTSAFGCKSKLRSPPLGRSGSSKRKLRQLRTQSQGRKADVQMAQRLDCHRPLADPPIRQCRGYRRKDDRGYACYQQRKIAVGPPATDGGMNYAIYQIQHEADPNSDDWRPCHCPDSDEWEADEQGRHRDRRAVKCEIYREKDSQGSPGHREFNLHRKPLGATRCCDVWKNKLGANCLTSASRPSQKWKRQEDVAPIPDIAFQAESRPSMLRC